MTSEEIRWSSKRDVESRTMKGLRPIGPGTRFALGAVFLVVGLVLGGALGRLAVTPVTTTTPTTDHLYLAIGYDPYTGLDEYFPANFTVPANAPIVITITNYDNGTNPVPAALGMVKGTVDGTATVTDGSGTAIVVRSVPGDQVTHTLTIESSAYDVNVPIPAAQGEKPITVSFTLVFAETGQFIWHCMAPCDDVALRTPGFMMGTITVVSG